MDLAVGAGAHLAAELATQPDDWMAAGEVARQHADLLPRPGERVGVIGCGSSLYAAQSIAAMRESAGLGETDAWPGGDPVLRRPYDRVIAITRSGTTTEILTALDRLDGRVPVTVITADPASPVVERGEVISIGFADEQSVVQSRTMTTAIALLRWHLGEDLTSAAEQARGVLALDEDWFADLRHAAQVSFVGAGWTYGLANEAALKLRESTQSWTDAWHQTEYRHGPISVAAPGRAVWALGPLIANLARDVSATGATLVHSDLDPLAELVKVHRLCVLLAGDRGLDADRPRNLTRSIVLEA
ncbi:sugar isomerase [Nocardioides sp. YIM 152315]|uniref:SIS domain-containing protein n=1 Tax=Nocardioides sp. YIM 152315 TaxID=3031760 RepID=UPI0023D9D9F1|nr:sugar isomerase [Nocardioides sp. YIM 152315]MDF1602614.1 sugar isomerase [Nocardioides sp. YIM 152315]